MNEAEKAAGLATTPGYRYAERADNQLFVAGQVPNDGEGQIVGIGDPYRQSRQCLDNLMTLLVTHEFRLEDIRQLVIYVVGERSNLVQAWAAVKERFIQGVPPATLLGVATLGYEGQLVEIDATVIKV